MDRAPTPPESVARALHLIGAPACACDAGGRIVASNAALRAWFGGDPGLLSMTDLFAGRAAAVQLGLAISGATLEWDAALVVGAQKAAEEATKKTLLEQKAIFDNASVGILFSKSGLMLTCNLRMTKMFGCTREQMTGHPVAEVFPSPGHYRQFGREAGPPLGDGRPFEQAECQFMRRDGSLSWCRVRVKAIDTECSEEGSIWIFEDVTAARQTLIEVQAIMTNASVGIVFTKNRLVTRYNRGFADLFGYRGNDGLACPAAPCIRATRATPGSAWTRSRCCRRASRSRPRSRWCARTAR